MMVARHFRRGLLILSVSTLGFFISSFSAVLASDFTSRIVSILDGDTLEVLHNQHPERIRLNGIDCPEKGQAYGQRAKQAASELVFGKEVTLQTHGLDKYGRTLTDVLLPDGTHAGQRRLVLEGLELDVREARKRAVG
jgi:endonuclease YncB( thermonuclease family)